LTAAVSLRVYVVAADASGRKTKVGEALTAGFESWRTEVWASPQVQALGAELFPRLGPGNEVIIKSHELQEFQRECTLLRENLDAICAGVDLAGQHGISVGHGPGQVVRASSSPEIFRDLVSQRLANIEDAIRRAAHAGGDVVIW
jgi:hypothetical protein